MLPPNLPEAAILRKAHQQGRQEGLHEGLREGLVEGVQEGRHALLTALLTHRFGPLPAWATQRLREAQPDTLSAWAIATLEAPSLEAILGHP